MCPKWSEIENVSYDDINKWRDLVGDDCYAKVEKSKVYDIIKSAETLFNDAPDDLLVMSSTSHSSISYAVDFQRYCTKHDMLDHEILFVHFDNDSESAREGMLHHGTYPGRSEEIPDEIRAFIQEAGINDYVPGDNYPSNEFGPKDELSTAGGIRPGFWQASNSMQKNPKTTKTKAKPRKK